MGAIQVLVAISVGVSAWSEVVSSPTVPAAAAGATAAGHVEACPPTLLVTGVPEDTGCGLEENDELVAWEVAADGEAEHGCMTDPVVWRRLVVEQAPRGRVRLQVERDGRTVEVAVRHGLEAVRVLPVDPRAGSAAREAQRGAGASAWEAAVQGARRCASGDDRPCVEGGMARASGLAPRIGSPLAGALARELEADVHEQRNNPEACVASAAAMLELCRATTPGSLCAARALNQLGLVAWNRGELTAAETWHRRALTLRQRFAPGSLLVAASLNNLGIVARDRGELEQARKLHLASLAVKERVAPGGADVVVSLNNLGAVARAQGRLAEAESCYRRALSIQSRLEPHDFQVAVALNNLGAVGHLRGDLATAEDSYARAVELLEELVPGSMAVALVVSNLGVVAFDRGDFETAASHHRRALEIRQKLAPGSLHVSDSLDNLAGIAFERGDLTAAEALYRESLAMLETESPDSLRVAETRVSLASTLLGQGQEEVANEALDRALGIIRQRAPGGLLEASARQELGEVALARQDLEAAEAEFRAALELRLRWAPDSTDEAASRAALGRTARAGGDLEAAAEHLGSAVGALERQAGRLGGTASTRARFYAANLDVYRAYVEVLVELGRPAEAFSVLERSRARLLLQMLAERDLDLGDTRVAELEEERQRLEWEHDRVMDQLGVAADDPADGARVERLVTRLADLRARRDEVLEAVAAAAPRLAALRRPNPLDAAGVAGLLEPHEALVSFSLGEDRSLVFVVAAERGLEVEWLDAGRREIERSVDRFRRLVARAQGSDAGRQALVEAGRRLYDQLLKPVDEHLKGCSHLVIVPDGLLHALPWAALVRSVPTAAGDRGWQYLVERMASTTVVSGTVLGELLAAGRGAQNHRAASRILVAFGDPELGDQRAAPVEQTGGAARLGRVRDGLEPLPAARAEVEGIAQLFGSSARVYVGAGATEAAARAVGTAVSYLHFATHGVVSGDLPLESALVLSAPAGGAEYETDGLLQAWEVFEDLRLDADLVVLSACDTGLGQELAGEGLIGLTRAFQFAGARSVLASLWAVGDETTAPLMVRVYENLEAGLDKDEALRRAQLAAIAHASGPDGDPADPAAQPVSWAAFQLAGAPR